MTEMYIIDNKNEQNIRNIDIRDSKFWTPTFVGDVILQGGTARDAALLREFNCKFDAYQLLQNLHMIESDNPDIVILKNVGLEEKFQNYFAECRVVDLIRTNDEE